MNDLVFVMYNSKLMERKQHSRKDFDSNFDDISSDDEWIVENDENSSNNEGLGSDDGDNIHDLEVENEDELHDIQVGEVGSNVASASTNYLDLDLSHVSDEIEEEDDDMDSNGEDLMEDEDVVDDIDLTLNELFKR